MESGCSIQSSTPISTRHTCYTGFWLFIRLCMLITTRYTQSYPVCLAFLLSLGIPMTICTARAYTKVTRHSPGCHPFPHTFWSTPKNPKKSMREFLFLAIVCVANSAPNLHAPLNKSGEAWLQCTGFA